MSRSKDKGRRLETQVVDLLTSAGIPAERVPLSGGIGNKYSDDVVIGSIDSPQARVECKNRESLAEYLWDYLDPVDYLVLKKNHKKPLVVMDFERFVALISVKFESKS